MEHRGGRGEKYQARVAMSDSFFVSAMLRCWFLRGGLVRRLLEKRYEITVLDNFSEQIHGNNRELASDLRGEVRLVVGDVRDEDAWRKAFVGQEVVIHFAAETGTGQSMYRVRHYTDVNIGGTSALVELLLGGKTQVQSLVVASSRAVYGEGAYKCGEHGTVYPAGRTVADMKNGEYEPKCPVCSQYRQNPGSLFHLQKCKLAHLLAPGSRK
jgi:dTDP-L-rhamnose 4-epimerase